MQLRFENFAQIETNSYFILSDFLPECCQGNFWKLKNWKFNAFKYRITLRRIFAKSQRFAKIALPVSKKFESMALPMRWGDEFSGVAVSWAFPDPVSGGPRGWRLAFQSDN